MSRVILLGRVYYDLIHEREERGAWNTAIIRVGAILSASYRKSSVRFCLHSRNAEPSIH